MKQMFSLKSVLVAVAIAAAGNLNAQWMSNGPYGGRALSLVDHSGNVFVGTQNGVFKSSDNGATWTMAGTALMKQHVYDLVSKGSSLYAPTDGAGIFVTTDMGATWTTKNTGLPAGLKVFSMFDAGTMLYAGTSMGVYKSSNNGSTWSAANSFSQFYVTRSWAMMGDSLYAGTYGKGLWRTHDNGATWTQVQNGFPTNPSLIYVYDLYVSGDSIYASTSMGLYLSDDRGASWNAFGSGMPQGHHVFSFVKKDGKLIASSPAVGIYVSNDAGANWTVSNSGIRNWSDSLDKYEWINELLVSGQKIIAASDEGVYASSDNGATWSYSDQGIVGLYSYGLASSQGNMFVGTSGSGVYRTSNMGSTWVRVNNGLEWTNAKGIAANSTHVFVSLLNGTVYRTTDLGANWTIANSGLPSSAPFMLAADDQKVVALFAKTPSQQTRLYISTNNGTSWTLVPNAPVDMSAVTVLGAKIFVGTDNGVVAWTDNTGATWHIFDGYMPKVQVSSILALESMVFVATSGHGVFRFTNNGENSFVASDGLESLWVSDLEMVNQVLFASTAAGVHATVNNGVMWFQVIDGMDDLYASALGQTSGKLFAGTSTRVYHTGDEEELFDRIMLLAGIKEAPAEDVSLMYPNPASNAVYFSSNSTLHISVSDMLGKTVMSRDLSAGSALGVSALNSGVYFVQITNGAQTTTRKLVVR
jgi:photosystem II stability/assembly factor-like uncharacterized protein